MKYTPSDVVQADLDTAEAPYLGGEFAVFLAEKPAVLLGAIEMTSSATCTYTKHNATDIVGSSADLQLVADSRLTSAVETVVTFNVVDDLLASTTATATFTPPDRALNQSFNLPRGWAVDLVVASGASRKIKSITSLASIAGGARGVLFALYQLPEAADYTLVGATTSKKFNTKSRRSVGIDSGMEADAFVKFGKTGKGELTIDSKHGSMADGLSRFDGARCTALLVGIKEEVLTTERLVFVGFRPSVEMDLPEGDGEAMANAATGKFQNHLFFVAP